MFFIGIILGLIIGFGISYIIGKMRAKERYNRQFMLRDSIQYWGYKHPSGLYPDPKTRDGRLLSAIFQVGTSNIHRHDRW